MATVIKSDRPACAPYLDRPAKFLREVEAGDPAFSGNPPQVVVEIDGREVYFFADEVIRDDKEKPKLAAVPPVQQPSGDEKPAVGGIVDASAQKPQPPTPAI